MDGSAVLDRLRFGDHMCLPVHGSAEQISIAEGFTRDGLRDGQKVLLAVGEPGPLRHRLATAVPGAVVAFATGQLEVLDSREVYLGDRGFHPDGLIGRFTAAAEEAEREGYPGIRIIGDLSGFSGALVPDELVDYEARINSIYAEHNALALCQYDPRALTGDVWSRLMSAHPGAVARLGDEPVSRLRGRPTESGIRLCGEADVVNRAALPQLLRTAERQPGVCEIDATGLRFADVRAITSLLRTASARGERRTTIVCTSGLAALLATFGAGGVPHLTVTVREGE